MNLTRRQKIGLGAGGAAVLAGVLYWRHKSAAGSPAAGAADPNAIDPLTGLPFSQDAQTDPVTGMTYLAEAQQYGSVAAAEAAFSGGGASGYGAGYGAASGGTAGYPTTNAGTAAAAGGGGYATNAQWAQAVQTGLASLGYDGPTVAAALGAFFAQLPLTPDQAQIIQAAEAEFGPPPQGTYAIVAQPSSGGASSSSSPPSSSGPSSTAIAVAPVDLHPTHVYANSAQVTWLAPRIPRGQTLTGYGVEAYDQGGHVVNGPFELGPEQLYANIGGLHSKTTYHVNVWARPAKAGGPHASTTFTTK